IVRRNRMRLFCPLMVAAFLALPAGAATLDPPKALSKAPPKQLVAPKTKSAVKAPSLPKAINVAKPVTPPELIDRLDGLIATADKGNVLIQARGAVSSGGWHKALLRPVKSTPADAHTIVVEFVATPPDPDRAVIEGLLPVHATTTVRMRRGVVSVRVIAGSNE